MHSEIIHNVRFKIFNKTIWETVDVSDKNVQKRVFWKPTPHEQEGFLKPHLCLILVKGPS